MVFRHRVLALFASSVLLVVAACAANPTDESDTLTGVVIAVDGTLQEVESFTLRLTDGTDATFVPLAGLLFDGTAPISHLRDHLATGDPVRVEYETLTDGTLSAVAVGDG